MNAAAAAVVVLNGRQAFDPRASLFAHNEPGAWYDPSDFSSLFQESSGVTPVTAVEQAVGLSLDKSRGLVLGSELYANQVATVDNTTGGATVTYTSATQTVSVSVAGSSASYPRIDYSLGMVAGRTYVVSGRIDGTRTGINILRLTTVGNANDIPYNSTTGVFAGRIVAGSSTLQIVHLGTVTGDRVLATLSVRELSGTHRIQPSAASRPILRARYNLLTYSEQFDNAAWAKTALNGAISANATTAPDGTLTADLYTEDSALAQRAILQTVAVLPGTHTQYVSAKNNGRRYVSLYPQGVGTAWAIFDLQTGAVSATGGANIAGSSITAQANGFYRCSVSVTVAAAGNLLPHVYLTNSNSSPAPAYTGDGVSGVFIWGADLRSANDTYLPYQRIEAATVYDTVGFPVYLSYDGSDDSMYTGGNLDLSGTDKVTVFAGVTKLSDAAQGIVAELSASLAANAGAFVLQAPQTASGTYGWASRGSAAISVVPVAGTFAAPITTLVTGLGHIGGDSIIVRVNGADNNGSGSDQGTGNFGSYPLYMGRRNNASLPFNGREFGLIVRGAATSATLIQQTERWMAAKQGRTL